MFDLDDLKANALLYWDTVIEWAMSPQFHAQVAGIVIAFIAARVAARQLDRRVSLFRDEPSQGRLLKLRQFIHACSDLLFPLLLVLFLAIAIEAALAVSGSAWLIRLAQSVGVVFLLYSGINRFVKNPLIRGAAIWIGIPVATLHVFGWYDSTVGVLDRLSLEIGNIRISAYFLIKAALFGGLLFWLGRMTSTAGQKVIRGQEALDIPTRELFAKLFEIALFFVVFILLLQVLGLDLTALAVFGGALGVGLGFGLQQVAANFISGIIILLERSLGVGDYIELESGKAGILKEINMRSSTLETFDGKEIMVPNEKFITTQFINWTRDDPRQRYEVAFSVAYETDLHAVPKLIEDAVSKHPQVLQEPEKPDCELRGFGDSGVDFAVEFWVDGLDDGKNKFSSDVLFLVWDALKENSISIPFPQREVRVLPDGPKLAVKRKPNRA